MRFAAACLVAALCTAATAQEFRAGVGRADITPEGPIWLAGYGGRKVPSNGIETKLWVKALAISDPAGNTSLLLCADTIGVPAEFTDALAARVADKLKVPRERFLLATSHSHATPVIHGALTGMYAIAGLTGEHQTAVKKYRDVFAERAFTAAEAAVKDLSPAKLSFGRGSANFAANRRAFKGDRVNFGVNPDGAVDRDVPVLRAVGADGKVRAIVYGYACHCTTLGPDFLKVCGDWAGYSQEHLEAAFPGSTALFITGCGADANPEPRGKLEFSRAHGLALAGSVARVLSEPMTPVAGNVRAAFAHADLPYGKVPTKEEFEKRLTDKNQWTVAHARKHLDLLAKGEAFPASYPCPVQVWRFGNDLTLVALGGEVVVDYALRLKRELPGERLWTAGYCNDVFAYVPSQRILIEGGYEADFNLIYYDRPTRFAPTVEDTLIRKVLELVGKTKAD